jgi:hypothetical protein
MSRMAITDGLALGNISLDREVSRASLEPSISPETQQRQAITNIPLGIVLETARASRPVVNAVQEDVHIRTVIT